MQIGFPSRESLGSNYRMGHPSQSGTRSDRSPSINGKTVDVHSGKDVDYVKNVCRRKFKRRKRELLSGEERNEIPEPSAAVETNLSTRKRD